MRFLMIPVLLGGLFLASCLSPSGASVEDKRQAIFDMREDALAELYEAYPQAREQVRRSEGYAVFSNIANNVLFVTSGWGYGIAKDQSSGEEAFMKMVSGGVGFGLGAKDIRQVLIFQNQGDYDNFLTNGWNVEGQADATAQSGEKGGGVGVAEDVDKDVIVYQITENGVSLSATVVAAKYFVTDDYE